MKYKNRIGTIKSHTINIKKKWRKEKKQTKRTREGGRVT